MHLYRTSFGLFWPQHQLATAPMSVRQSSGDNMIVAYDVVSWDGPPAVADSIDRECEVDCWAEGGNSRVCRLVWSIPQCSLEYSTPKNTGQLWPAGQCSLGWSTSAQCEKTFKVWEAGFWLEGICVLQLVVVRQRHSLNQNSVLLLLGALVMPV